MVAECQGDELTSRAQRTTGDHHDRRENVQILDSYIGDIGRTIIDFEPASAGGGAKNVLIEGNTFGRSRHFLMSSGGAGPNVDTISLIGNHIIDIGLNIKVRAADGSRRENYRILNNISEVRLGLPVPALRFSRVDGIEVRGNYQ